MLRLASLGVTLREDEICSAIITSLLGVNLTIKN